MYNETQNYHKNINRINFCFLYKTPINVVKDKSQNFLSKSSEKKTRIIFLFLSFASFIVQSFSSWRVFLYLISIFKHSSKSVITLFFLTVTDIKTKLNTARNPVKTRCIWEVFYTSITFKKCHWDIQNV